MLTISLKSSELPGGGAAKMMFTSYRMKLCADIIMQVQNTQYLTWCTYLLSLHSCRVLHDIFCAPDRQHLCHRKASYLSELKTNHTLHLSFQ